VSRSGYELIHATFYYGDGTNNGNTGRMKVKMESNRERDRDDLKGIMEDEREGGRQARGNAGQNEGRK
jgi:hypothetical protein